MPRRPRSPRPAPSRAARATGRGGAHRALHVALLALGILFGQGTALIHLLVVPHATCEHGELVEIHASPRAAPLADDSAKQPRVTAAAPGATEHEHCNERACLLRVPQIGPALGEAQLLSVEPATTLGERGETRPVNLLSLAPKSSPPAA
jgi:hypothetical protein